MWKIERRILDVYIAWFCMLLLHGCRRETGERITKLDALELLERKMIKTGCLFEAWNIQLKQWIEAKVEGCRSGEDFNACTTFPRLFLAHEIVFYGTPREADISFRTFLHAPKSFQLQAQLKVGADTAWARRRRRRNQLWMPEQMSHSTIILRCIYSYNFEVAPHSNDSPLLARALHPSTTMTRQ